MIRPEMWALIVDDEPEMRKTLREYVELHSGIPVGVVESDNGMDALGKLTRQRFELLITDLAMPRMRGERLVESLQSLPPNRRPRCVLVLSAYIKAGSAILQPGPLSFVPKPFEPRKLIDYLHKVFAEPQVPAEAPPQNHPAAPEALHHIDVSFVNPFIDATLKVLETTCSTPARKEVVFVRKKDQVSGDVSAVIAMNSSKFMGSMAIAFDADCFLAIVNRMLATDYKEINEENADAAGELCNQVFGLAKAELNRQGHDIQSAIPSVVTGSRHSIKHLVEGTCIAVVFKTDHGYFTVEAAL